MKCLYCGKEIPSSSAEEEKTFRWHHRCVKKFFGTSCMPDLSITDSQLEKLASYNVSKGLTVPGVQKKLSLHLSHDTQPRLTLVDYPTGYILKPQSGEYPHLPEAEQLCMSMADATGIKTVPHALLLMKDETYAYITRRVDRVFPFDEQPGMVAMEDFCQLSGRLTMDKYNGSYEQCAKILRKYSSMEMLDLSELFLRLLFCFVTGNSDMHYKNFSMIEDAPASRIFHLSPAYDLLCVNVVLPEDKEETALTLNGKKRNLHRKDFLRFAETAGLNGKAAEKIMAKVIGMEPAYEQLCRDSDIPEEMKNAFCSLLKERTDILSDQ